MAEHILIDLGFLKEDAVTSYMVPLEKCMMAKKHYPPANFTDGIIPPCNGRLFAATRLAQNLQICTGYLASCYLAKYIAGIDDVNQVHVGASVKDPNGISVEMQFLHNTKVTSSAITEKIVECTEGSK